MTLRTLGSVPGTVATFELSRIGRSAGVLVRFDFRIRFTKGCLHTRNLWTVPAAGRGVPKKSTFNAQAFRSIVFLVASLVYLTARTPSKFAEELMLAGHQVHEAIAVTEALYLCEHQRIDVIVIAGDVEDPDFAEAQLRYLTIRLKPDATAKQLVWELSQLFHASTETVQ